MPIFPCASAPQRYRAASSVSLPCVWRRNSASKAVFSVFFGVARTRPTSSTNFSRCIWLLYDPHRFPSLLAVLLPLLGNRQSFGRSVFFVQRLLFSKHFTRRGCDETRTIYACPVYGLGGRYSADQLCRDF